MSKIQGLGICMIAFFLCESAHAAITSSTTHNLDPGDPHALDAQIVTDDLIAGMIPILLPGDNGWHPVNTNPADQLPAFTDGSGALGILTGLLNDFPNDVENVPPEDEEDPTKLVEYALDGPANIERIQILTGNANINTADQGVNGRVFSTTVINYSRDYGQSFELLGYFESDPLGTVNSIDGMPGRLEATATLVEIFDDASTIMISGVTHIQFLLYSVSNTQGQYRDPYDGVNPFTGIDDTLAAAFESPLVWEIDVIGQIGMNPADFNNDSFVDDQDLTLWETGFGMDTGAMKVDGDADTDGDVDGNDFLIWQKNYGLWGSGLATAAVPEPATFGLVLMMALAALPGILRLHSS